MKIKIKSREEIEKTLNLSGFHLDGSGAYFSHKMFSLVGKELLVIESNLKFNNYKVRTDNKNSPSGGWNWHPDWYEVIEDFNEEDEFIIKELNEILQFIMESRS